MGTIQSYKDLQFWRLAMDLAELVYRQTASFPKNEMYEMTKQMRRSAVSVPSNIAEGKGRHSTSEYRHFLVTARGSLYEIETQSMLASRLGYMTEEQLTSISILVERVGRMLNALMSSLPKTYTTRFATPEDRR